MSKLKINIIDTMSSGDIYFANNALKLNLLYEHCEKRDHTESYEQQSERRERKVVMSL